MDNSQNNVSTLPDKNEHNSFAKIIKTLFHDDFIFSNCWYERINEDSEAGGSEAEGQSSAWQAISSCRFNNIVLNNMEHLKNTSENILKNLPITKILKNLVGQFQSIEVSF